MKILDKVNAAKVYLDSLLMDDAAPMELIEQAKADLLAHIDARMADAPRRRAEYAERMAAERAEQQIAR